MKGSIHFRKDNGRWYVKWYDAKLKKYHTIPKYKGEYIYNKKIAQKLLALMQGDFEQGVFDIRKYKMEWVNTVGFLEEWLEEVAPTLSPATYKDYKNSIKNHLAPFFLKTKFELHEIKYDVLLKLLNSINRKGKGKQNVMYCLHACLDHAWKSEKITAMPPFPEKKHYQITEKVIEWISEDRQINVINKIDEHHQPIFWFLKYHLRRPSEAMAMHRLDFNPELKAFTICRAISARKEIDRTKTKKTHLIPCHPNFLKTAMELYYRPSKYFFTNPLGRKDGKRYTNSVLNHLWNEACKIAGENIPLYDGTKHSSCCQYINEKGLSMSELKEITDHARMDSVEKYAKTELKRKAELMQGKLIKLNKKKKRTQ